MLKDASPQKKIERQTIIDAIDALRAKGWDINPYTVADEAKIARSALFRNSEFMELLSLARQRLEDWQIWVNPDCGLKTRKWEEVRPALQNLVAAARLLRQQ